MWCDCHQPIFSHRGQYKLLNHTFSFTCPALCPWPSSLTQSTHGLREYKQSSWGLLTSFDCASFCTSSLGKALLYCQELLLCMDVLCIQLCVAMNAGQTAPTKSDTNNNLRMAFFISVNQSQILWFNEKCLDFMQSLLSLIPIQSSLTQLFIYMKYCRDNSSVMLFLHLKSQPSKHQANRLTDQPTFTIMQY